MKINKRAGIILLVCIVVLVLLRFYVKYKRFNHNIPHTTQTFNRKTGHLVLTRHARCRMQCRDISEQEINEILRDGEIDYNKSELNEPRGPRYALEGYSHEHQHLRVIFAPENDDIVVVTCIDLDRDWPCPSCD